MAGFAVDVGTLFRAKRNIQTAADAAAISGAAEINYGDWKAAAKAAATQNGITDGSGGATVTVNNPPASGSHASGVEVIITVSEPTYFMKVFNLASMNVSARAVAGLGAASGCIYTLDTSGTDVGLSGSGALSMPSCGIVVNSASSKAVSISGSSSITAQSVGIVGSFSDSSSGNITPTPITGVAPSSDPLSFLTPPSFTSSSCHPDPHINGGTATLGPSISGGTVCYNGISINGSSVVTLNPGLYIINGSFNCNASSTITGTAVTFFLAAPNGSASLTGSTTLNVTAPTSGTWNGILFFQDPSDSNAMQVSGSGSSTIAGIFYAPAASLTFSGSSGGSIYADLVVGSLTMSGSSTFSSYSTVNSSEPLQSSRLTE